MDALLWERVGELADRAPRLSDLRHHKLHLVAASRMRARGEAVPPSCAPTSATPPRSRSAPAR